MTRDDYTDFAEAWFQVSEVYGRTPSDGAMDLMFNALQRFSLDDIKRALTAHVNDPQHGDFPPKPADVVRHIEGDTDSRSLSAWSKVEDAIRLVGPHQSLVFDDPRLMAVVQDMGGWIELCDVDDRELPFKRNEFTKRYQGYLQRPPEHYPARLIGIAEFANHEHPEFKPEPRLFGDHQQCLAVMERGEQAKRKSMPLGEALAGISERLTSNHTETGE